jgi:SMC interacting uncharacterized protein involved in chromosome segregation
MTETELLRKMVDDVESLKEQMTRIEIAINEIDNDIHREVNPEYLKKLVVSNLRLKFSSDLGNLDLCPNKY